MSGTAALPATAQARDATVTSFDGTPIAASFLPATGLGDFKRLLETMVEESDKVPAKAEAE